MKKFLTVLLALSVVFTYTVGTAFATATVPGATTQISESDVRGAINDAADLAVKDLGADKTDALNAYLGGIDKMDKLDNSLTVTRTALDKALTEEIYDDAASAIETKRNAMLLAVDAAIRAVTGKYTGYFTTETTSPDADYQEAGYAVFSTDLAGYDEMSTYADSSVSFIDSNNSIPAAVQPAVAKAVFAEEVDKVEKYIASINLDNYSKEYNNTTQSNYDKVADLINQANAKITAAKYAVSSAKDANVWNTAATQITTLKSDIYLAGVGTADPTGTIAVAIAAIPTIADEPTEATKLEYAQNKVLTKVTTEINTWKTQQITAANNTILEETLKGDKADTDKIAQAKKDLQNAEDVAAAATEVVNYLVKNIDDIDKLLSPAVKITDRAVLADWAFTGTALNVKDTKDFSHAELLAVVKLVSDLKDEAELLKASVQLDGAEYVEIEKALEAAIDDAYTTGKAELKGLTAVSNLYNRQEALISGNPVVVNSKKYNTVDNWVSALNGKNTIYDEKYYDEVRSILAETKANIRAAETIADAEAAFLAGYEKLDAVPTKQDAAKARNTKEFKDLLAEYQNDIIKYTTYKNGIIDASEYNWTPRTMYTKLNQKLAAAYDVEELKATYAEAKAEIDNLKTKAALAEEKKAIEDEIAKLPTVLTVADRATVGALQDKIDAYTDYITLIGATNAAIVNTPKVDQAYDRVKALEAKAIADAIDAIGEVTVDDAEAIAALRATLDDYVSYYAGEDATDAEIAVLENIVGQKANLNKTVSDLEGLLEDAQIKAFKDMVAKLPADGSDVEGIKAARAAYEALSRDAKYEVYQGKYYDKLVDLEKLIVRNVEALKITASSTAKKGSITVKWTVKGNAAAADGYQIFRSVKKNSGFGTKPIFTTAKQTYKNTKSLKKGTRYYYKVRAYAEIDGVKYYSDWSNKAYRIAK